MNSKNISNKLYYENNKEAIKLKKKEYYEKNKQKHIVSVLNSRRKNPEGRAAAEKRHNSKPETKLRHRIAQSNRRAKTIRATPLWITPQHLEEIRKIYASCPVGYHVDHIVPLLGKSVRGLHVPWNLQYLPAISNLRKGNRLCLG